MFMAPLSWSAMLAALGIIGLSLARLATGRDPEILRFRASQLQVGLALMATVVLLGKCCTVTDAKAERTLPPSHAGSLTEHPCGRTVRRP